MTNIDNKNIKQIDSRDLGSAIELSDIIIMHDTSNP